MYYITFETPVRLYDIYVAFIDIYYNEYNIPLTILLFMIQNLL